MTTNDVPLLTAQDATRLHRVWPYWNGDPVSLRLLKIMDGTAVVIPAAELAELRKDAGRLDFLESLTKRVGISGHKQTPWPLDTDMHIGSRGASIYARTGIGSNTEFTVGGATVRGAIDAAMEKKS